MAPKCKCDSLDSSRQSSRKAASLARSVYAFVITEAVELIYFDFVLYEKAPRAQPNQLSPTIIDINIAPFTSEEPENVYNNIARLT